MKHNYISCDCCGKVINAKLDIFYRINRRGLCFGPFYPDRGSKIDLCLNCWIDIQNYVKEKRNATMA